VDFLFTIFVIGMSVALVHCIAERLCRWLEKEHALLVKRWGKMDDEVTDEE
jgi:hypothetical protein